MMGSAAPSVGRNVPNDSLRQMTLWRVCIFLLIIIIGHNAGYGNAVDICPDLFLYIFFWCFIEVLLSSSAFISAAGGWRLFKVECLIIPRDVCQLQNYSRIY